MDTPADWAGSQQLHFHADNVKFSYLGWGKITYATHTTWGHMGVGRWCQSLQASISTAALCHTSSWTDKKKTNKILLLCLCRPHLEFGSVADLPHFQRGAETQYLALKILTTLRDKNAWTCNAWRTTTRERRPDWGPEIYAWSEQCWQ